MVSVLGAQVCLFGVDGVRSSVGALYSIALDLVFVSDVVKSFDTVVRGLLDYVLCRVGLPGWFRHAYFQYHAHLRLRFKLSCGLGQSWKRDGASDMGVP